MKHLTWIGWILGCASGITWGNVGGFVARGGVRANGDVRGFEPVATENIRILEEKLTANLGPTQAEVEVRYIMKNLTSKQVKAKFGFPVEESFDQNVAMPPGQPNPPAQTEPKYCQGYQITAAGKPLKAKWQAETDRSKNDLRFAGLAGWLVSEASFAGDEEKVVTLRFTSEYLGTSYQAGGRHLNASRIFNYRLSSAACWAGTIGTGRILIRANGVNPQHMLAVAPVNKFHRDGNDWVWNFENLEPTLADDIKFATDSWDEVMYDTHDGTCTRRGNEWTMEHSNFKATASSVLPPEGKTSFDAANVVGFNNGTWAEGKPGPGIGEWLELRPVVAKPLRSLTLKPGYQATDELFKANARPKRIKVILNGEHHFTADIPDRKASCTIPVTNYDEPVKVVKLVFEEVWPGSHFEDLCVSGIIVEAKLDKKPKVEPRR